jgi:hypothetical protein
MSLINDALKRASQAQKQNAPERPKLAPLQPVENLRPGIDWSSYLLPALLAIVLMAAGAFLWSWASSRRQGNVPVEAVKAPPAVVKGAPAPETATAPVEAPVPKPAPPPPVTVVSKPAIKINTNIIVRPSITVVKPVEIASAPAPDTAAPAAASAPSPATARTVEPPTVRPVTRAIPASAPAQIPATTALTTTSEPQPAAVATPSAPARAETSIPAVPPQQAPAPPSISRPLVADPPKSEFPRFKIQGIIFRRVNPYVIVNGRSCYVGDTIEGARVAKIERLSVFLEFGGQTREMNLEP